MKLYFTGGLKCVQNPLSQRLIIQRDRGSTTQEQEEKFNVFSGSRDWFQNINAFKLKFYGGDVT